MSWVCGCWRNCAANGLCKAQNPIMIRLSSKPELLYSPFLRIIDPDEPQFHEIGNMTAKINRYLAQDESTQGMQRWRICQVYIRKSCARATER